MRPDLPSLGRIVIGMGADPLDELSSLAASGQDCVREAGGTSETCLVTVVRRGIAAGTAGPSRVAGDRGRRIEHESAALGVTCSSLLVIHGVRPRVSG